MIKLWYKQNKYYQNSQTKKSQKLIIHKLFNLLVTTFEAVAVCTLVATIRTTQEREKTDEKRKHQVAVEKELSSIHNKCL